MKNLYLEKEVENHYREQDPDAEIKTSRRQASNGAFTHNLCILGSKEQK